VTASAHTRRAFAPGAALLAAGLLAVAAAPAGAAITSTRDAPTVVRLAVDPARFMPSPKYPPTFYTGSGKIVSLPPAGDPVGTGEAASALVPFPLDDTGFIVMSTGDATQADRPDRPGTFPDADDGGPALSERGANSTARDVTVLQISFVTPAGKSSSCLSFDLRFLSEEYPSRLTSAFNDAFVAEMDATTWTATGSTISAPGNFAALPGGQPLTIKSTGFAAMSPAEAAGTPYGAATALLHAHITVSPGTTHTLYLSLFDHGDSAVDSAVFIDDLTLSTPAGDCTASLSSPGPAVAITGPTVAATVDTPTPTLSGTATGPGDVTVRIYEGPLAAGTPVQTVPAMRSGDTWSAPAAPLAPGRYTAQATQADATGFHGVSAPTTFTVSSPAAPVAAAEPRGASSSEQSVGDRDDDGIPDDQDSSDGSLPPVPGKTFDARVVAGEVFIKLPPGAGPRQATSPPQGFVPLKGAANVPIGAQLDTRAGRVAVTSAADTSGSRAQTADFYQGVFQVKQTVPKKKPKKAKALTTDLILKGELPRSQCGPLKGARAAGASKKGPNSVLGQLWGNGKGKFRTSGKYSSATVRGTIWLTQDRCDGTLTQVTRGTVQVADFRRKTTVSVKAGHSYLARAQRAASKAGRKK
jgi:hypothetical protein